jgi:hypothetical protein
MVASINASQQPAFRGGGGLGPELIVNGDMSSAVGWTLNDRGGLAVCTITGGALVMEDPEGVAPLASQDVLETGKDYKVVVTIASKSGFLSLQVEAGAGSAEYTDIGTYEANLSSGASTLFRITLTSGEAVSVTSVSVREIL